jgi:hypothetical protein
MFQLAGQLKYLPLFGCFQLLIRFEDFEPRLHWEHFFLLRPRPPPPAQRAEFCSFFKYSRLAASRVTELNTEASQSEYRCGLIEDDVSNKYYV